MGLWDNIMKSDWLQHIAISSVPMWKYDSNGIPLANASGCLVDYAGARFLLSIAHASIATDEWNFEVKTVHKFEDGQWGTLIKPVKMNSLKEFRLIEETNIITPPKVVDFTYLKIPKEMGSIQHIRFADGTLITAKRTVFTPDFSIKPSPNRKYGFFGQVRFSGTEGRRIVFDHRLEHDLTYTGKENDMYVFRLSHPYGSHSGYQGCSGAPIIDEDGNLIALVSYGRKSTNSIYAIDINKYKASLDIEAGPPLTRKI